MVINPIYLGVYMKKTKKGQDLELSLIKNPVAKFAHVYISSIEKVLKRMV